MSSLDPPMMNAPAIDSRQLRHALGAFATGVTIVTTRDTAGHDIGLTVNSFSSVSLDPPMVLWSLSRHAHSLAAFLSVEHFAVHILAADQEPLSNLFAQTGADKFAGLSPGRGHGGVPLLDGCSARFECRTAFRHAGGDHEIFVGEVITFEHFDRAPLVFQRGRYAFAVPKPEAASNGAAGEAESNFSREFLGYLLGRAQHQLMRHLMREFDLRGLTEEQYFVLSVLGAEDNRTLRELDAAAALAGRSVPPEQVRALAQRGFVMIDASPGLEARARLTELGLRTDIELVAIAKAAEADVQNNLDYAEAQTLKALLKRLVGEREPHGPPN